MKTTLILKSIRLILSGAIVGIAIASVIGIDHNTLAGFLGAGPTLLALKSIPALL